MKTIEERYGCTKCSLASCEGCDSFLLARGATEQKAIDDAKYQRLRSLAKMMYDAAMCLTTDASKLREACNEFKHYINYEEKE